MELLDRARVSGESGVQGDFRGRPGQRQVTVLALEGWRAACADLGQDVDWTSRRANLLVEGLPLAGSAGGRIVIGDLVLEITGETDPCSRMDEASEGLRRARVRCGSGAPRSGRPGRFRPAGHRRSTCHR